MEAEKNLTAAEKRKARKTALKERLNEMKAKYAKAVGMVQKDENKKRKGRLFILGLLYAQTFKTLDAHQQQTWKDNAAKKAHDVFKGQERNLTRALDALDWLLPPPDAPASDPSAQPATKEPLPCPLCGKQLIRKTRQADGQPFWGCPGFPGCSFTRNTSTSS